jgi:hypothetical protein
VAANGVEQLLESEELQESLDHAVGVPVVRFGMRRPQSPALGDAHEAPGR